MKYLGGKVRVSKSLTTFLTSIRKPNQLYVEPFVGGGAVVRYMADPRIASDLSEDLILFYKALQSGWEPPEEVSVEEYKTLRKADPSALRGFVGFFCSFGGKWFGGYARSRRLTVSNANDQPTRNYASEAHRDSLKLSKDIIGVQFYNSDYHEVLKSLRQGCLIYCDPPYESGTQYKFKFDHDEFWGLMRQYSETHDIVISEYSAPDDFNCVWSQSMNTSLNVKGGGKGTRVERAFVYRDSPLNSRISNHRVNDLWSISEQP